ncbi:replication protein A 32 kDa subunit-like isoform X2 [Myripristis murdjan]|uniref:replication protein A 32 kDa subunit-like isoform X2 n=1 Tax=Myripristis murdjan TaxID=586833 RepID=UPI001176373D|nr:replication protein A 32 kDa subunit-like isoform X2 [Myripristis murdjan]
MLDEGYSQSSGGFTGQTAVKRKRAALQILPCTVSQLLSASEVNEVFLLRNCEVNQVSVVGVVREFVPFVTSIKYTVHDMTGPPMDVKQWAAGVTCTLTPPGRYVKVSGRLQSSQGKRLLLAKNIRCIEDLNEITSHMLEVVQAHMQLFRKAVDVNMNTIASSVAGTVQTYGMCNDGCPQGISPDGLSTIQGQVFSAIKSCSLHEGIGFQNLTRQLGYLSVKDIRNSLRFLLTEGHIFTTMDEWHFKSTDN